jgi:predicted nucleic acid-binding protein
VTHRDTKRVVIADAGPLIALARVEALYLLRDLFGRVCITTTVRNELLPAEATFSDFHMLTQALNEGWIDVVDVAPLNYKPLNPGVDAGEASSIQVAKQWQEAGDAVLIVMDDRAGRLEAKSRDLTLIGSAAVIGLAKTQGLIPAARPLLEQMLASGYFIGPSVVSVILANVGE